MPLSSLSIVMPVLNEEAALSATLAALAPLLAQGAELVVADGGSADASAALAGAAGAQVVHTPRGRAVQMNGGAHRASREFLLFLHADTLLPPGGAQAVCRALEAGAPLAWGRFDVRIEGRHPLLSVIAWFMNRRSRLTGVATGDQALFMTRSLFEQVGGYPNQPLMEDVELTSRLRRLCAPVCLRQRVTTSGRRWEQRGVWRTMVLMWRLRWAYWRGVDPALLARRYR